MANSGTKFSLGQGFHMGIHVCPPPSLQHMQEASLVFLSSVALAKPPELSRVSVSLTEEGMVVLFDCYYFKGSYVGLMKYSNCHENGLRL